MEDKNLEIKQLTLQISEYKHQKEETTTAIEKLPTSANKNENPLDDLSKLAQRIKSNSNELKEYETIIDYIQRDYTPLEKPGISTKFLILLESYDIINRQKNGSYIITDTGKKFYRLINN